MQKRIKEGAVMRRAAAICLTAFMMLANLPPKQAALAADGVSSDVFAIHRRDNVYDLYLQSHDYAQKPLAEVKADNLKAIFAGDGYALLDHFEGRQSVLMTGEEGYAEWTLEVPESGLYNIEITCFPVEGKSSSIVRSLRIDGEQPFYEADNLIFSRVWKDAEPIQEDSGGNEVRPRQIEAPRWETAVCSDAMGYHSEPFEFYLEAGVRSVRLTSVKEPMAVSGLRLFRCDETRTYEEVSAEYSKLSNGTGKIFKRQAEKAHEKSDPMLYPVYDRSSPATEPYHVSKIRLNTIGGDKWKIPGQWIS